GCDPLTPPRRSMRLFDDANLTGWLLELGVQEAFETAVGDVDRGAAWPARAGPTPWGADAVSPRGDVGASYRPQRWTVSGSALDADVEGVGFVWRRVPPLRSRSPTR